MPQLEGETPVLDSNSSDVTARIQPQSSTDSPLTSLLPMRVFRRSERHLSGVSVIKILRTLPLQIGTSEEGSQKLLHQFF